MKPGWGSRHPDVTALLAGASPLAGGEVVFGTAPLRVSAYFELATPPDDLVLSVRCVVRVADKFVVCTTVDGGSHPWPGGRREAGESFADTAQREVHEETGWLLDVASLRHLGWLHFEHLGEMTQPEFPWPDFFQIVFVADASERAAATWTDTEGYEASSQLMSLDDCLAAFAGDPLARVFLDLLP